MKRQLRQAKLSGSSHMVTSSKKLKQTKLKSSKPLDSFNCFVPHQELEKDNLKNCSDINLSESVKKDFLRRYKQNLSVARHYLLQLEVDLKEAKLIDQASLESEKEKDALLLKQKIQYQKLYDTASVDELKQQCFPSSQFLDIGAFKSLLEHNRESCIKFLKLEKESLKLYPTSSQAYFRSLCEILFRYGDIEEQMECICRNIKEISEFLFIHPEERDPSKELFCESSDSPSYQIIDDGVIEIL